MGLSPENWFARMHRAVEHPEEAEALSRIPKAEKVSKPKEKPPAKEPARDYLGA